MHIMPIYVLCITAVLQNTFSRFLAFHDGASFVHALLSLRKFMHVPLSCVYA